MDIPSEVFYYESIGSTQEEARKKGDGIHWTTDQTCGRGRYERVWYSEPGRTLAVSICLPAYMKHPKPYLIGMAVALCVAEELDLQVQWPNDLLLNGKKVAGLLTEIYGRLPIIGIGLNLSQTEFPTEIEHRATSLVLAGRSVIEPNDALARILESIKRFEPALENWNEISQRWLQRDRTEGKIFKLQDGRMGTAQGITEEGFLIWNDTVTTEIVPVAEALWGYREL